MGTECWLLQIDSHELMTIDLMHSSPQGHSSFVSPTILLLEGSTGLVLLIFGGPLQLYLDMQLPLGLQLQPDIMQGLSCLLYQVRQRQLAVGNEVIWRYSGIMEHSEAHLLC